ncbi:MAG: hypothetical protein NWR72_21665 [Bacteroidia bacterium]|nr:hypothetical protein [Bacteroidia bacterium]
MKTIQSFWSCASCLGVGAFILLLSGCKGDTPGPGDYFLSFKANGEKVTFTENVFATPSQSGGIHVMLVTGTNQTIQNANLQLYSDRPITDSLYTEGGISGMIPYGALMGYAPEAGQLFISAGGQVRITVEEVNDEFARGTFTATLKESGFPDMIITEGEFLGKINK